MEVDWSRVSVSGMGEIDNTHDRRRASRERKRPELHGRNELRSLTLAARQRASLLRGQVQRLDIRDRLGAERLEDRAASREAVCDPALVAVLVQGGPPF